MSDTPRTDAFQNERHTMNAFRKVLAFARQLERELAAMTAERDQLKARVVELERGEYICKKCGLRKDGEHEKGDFSQ